MFDRKLSLRDVLDGDVDVEVLLADYPADFTVKGMFCTRMVDMLGADGLSALTPRLLAPPRSGHYVAFKDYPQADYSRLVMAAAHQRFPELGAVEAARRVARDDFAAFSASMVGKVMLSLVGDAHTALLRMPEAYERIISGLSLRSEELDARSVRVTCDRYHGVHSYFLGQLEGVVVAFGSQPASFARRLGPHTLQVDVTCA